MNFHNDENYATLCVNCGLLVSAILCRRWWWRHEVLASLRGILR